MIADGVVGLFVKEANGLFCVVEGLGWWLWIEALSYCMGGLVGCGCGLVIECSFGEAVAIRDCRLVIVRVMELWL